MFLINHQPTQRELFWFGWAFTAFWAMIGFIAWRAASLSVAGGFWTVGSVLMVTYAALPRTRRPIFMTWSYLTFPLGWVGSHVLLAAIYFLVVTPIGLAARIVGYDPLRLRKGKQDAPTYWVRREDTRDPQDYFRQF